MNKHVDGNSIRKNKEKSVIKNDTKISQIFSLGYLFLMELKKLHVFCMDGICI